MHAPLLARILVRPRETMRWILDNIGTRGTVAIVIIACVSGSTKQVDARRGVEAFQKIGPVMSAVAVVVVIATIAFTVLLYFGLSWLAMWSGRFVGGSGSYTAVRSAIAWGFVPIIWALLYRIPAMFLWPAAFVKSSPKKTGVITFQAPGSAELYQIAIIAALEAIIWVWYLVVASNTLAEAQGISSWAGLGNLLMAWALPFVGGIAIALAVYLAF